MKDNIFKPFMDLLWWNTLGNSWSFELSVKYFPIYSWLVAKENGEQSDSLAATTVHSHMVSNYALQNTVTILSMMCTSPELNTCITLHIDSSLFKG